MVGGVNLRSIWPSVLCGALVGWSSLSCIPSARAALAARVVHVSVDGLAGISLQSFINAAPANFPGFSRLSDEGASTFNARCDYDYSETIPNHATMFTARPVLQPVGLPATTHHGYNNNFPLPDDTFHANGNPAVAYKASFFDVAHDYGLTTALYVSKERLTICDRSYNAIHGAPDGVAPDNGIDKIDDTYITDTAGMVAMVDALVADLGSSPAHYTFLHLTEPDTTGHASGWPSMAYSNAVRLVDTQVGKILTAVALNPAMASNTIVIVTADHGGGGSNTRSHTDATHFLNYTIPFFIWGNGIPAGADLYSLFSNRGNPGTNYVNYTANPQPFRNGDGGNLALSLLGLPPIPGSFMIPLMAPPKYFLEISRRGPDLFISWPAAAEGFQLVSAENLEGPLDWQPVTEDIEAEGDRLIHRPDPAALGSRFYQLIKRE